MNTKNMIKLLLITIVSLVPFLSVFAQNSDESNPAGARQVMLKFAELNNRQLLQTSEARLLLSGSALEWKDNWFGHVLSSPDKIISDEKDYAVARVQTIEKVPRVVNLYFYLRFDNGWKINSMRAMAQTGWLESIKTELKSKSVLTAEEKETLANVELTLSSDKTLTEWFQKNRPACDRLVALALLETKKKTPPPPPPPPKPKIIYRNGVKIAVVSNSVGDSSEAAYERETRTIETITASATKFPRSAAALKNLHFSALEVKGSGNLEITIGGITDNSVGFIYSPMGKPPAIDGRNYIWVEEIAAGWYLFRTT